jgi:uncharacterized repeat protein (TIGR03803 family)
MRGASLSKITFLIALFYFAGTMVAQAQTFQVLANFHGSDGSTPTGRLVQGPDGNFYGTTLNGGASNFCPPPIGPDQAAGCGIIFQATPGGGLTTLYNFCSLAVCTDGSHPWAGMVLGSDGNFYGTTSAGGGGYGIGTVFQLLPGQGPVIVANISNDATVSPGLVEGSDGNIYGASNFNGAFQLTPSGALTTIYGFQDGSSPTGSMVQGTDGNFYGTTANTISSSVFRLSPEPGAGCPSGSNTGNGWCETVLHSFCSSPNCADGQNPEGGVAEGSDGNFYGTTSGGGANNFCRKATGVPGCGTVFRITPNGVLTTLYNFCSLPRCSDGAVPFGGLVLGSDGNFYGTTTNGGKGAHGDCSNLHCGTLFQLTPGGSLTTLHSFCSWVDCSDGGAPYASLIEAGGTFYGTTSMGFTGAGAIFSWSADVAVAPTISPTFLTFPNVVLGHTSVARRVSITNADPVGTLDFTSLTVTGPFAISDEGCRALKTGKTCNVSIVFTPTAVGTATGTLSMGDNAPNSPQTVTLTGTGRP